MRRRLSIVASVAIALLAIPLAANGALTQSYQQTGNIGLEMVGSAAGNFSVVTGTLTLSPAVSPPVHKAFLYANDWNNSGGSLDLSLNAFTVGSVPPFASDAAFSTLYAYRWDVTNQVIGPGAYNYTIGANSVSGNQIAGVALAVVYGDPSAPMTTVSIIDGAKQLGESGVPETESASFTGLPAGATTLHTFTVSDDNTDSGEVVKYNGFSVGGPIDQNLGMNASLLTMSATSVAGMNTVSVSTGMPPPAGTDHFGWIVAANEVPEPATLSLLALGGLAVMRRRKK